MKFKIGDKVICNGKEYLVEEVFDYDRSYIIADLEGFKCRVVGKYLKSIKPTINDLRDYMLEHFVNEYGNLNIIGLDFSEFDGSVDISDMKVKGNLFQNGYNVQENLCQSGHKVQGDLFQNEHKVQGYLVQNRHKVQGYLYQSEHEVQGDYICQNIKYGGELIVDEPQKMLKEITEEELAELGYKLKGVN